MSESTIREVKTQGEIDASNSSTTPLSGGATFTGTSTEILDTGVIFVNVYSDVASATDGLVIEQSSDGTNWDHVDNYTIPAATGKNYAVNPHSQYMRVKYTNGAAAQSAFRLQTKLFAANALESSHSIRDSITTDDDARLVKAVITGENGDNIFENVRVTPDGSLSIVESSSGLAIASGDVTGTTFIHKFGQAPDFDISDGDVTIWDGAADSTAWENMVYDYSATADIDSISSSNAGDTQDIEIQGLDTNFAEVTQTATLNGQTRVALSTSLVRVFRLKNVGSTDLAGVVAVYPNTALTAGLPTDKSKIRAVINDGNNQTLMALYTIPAGKTGYLRDWYASLSAKKTAVCTLKLVARPEGQVFQLKHVSDINSAGSSYVQHKYQEPEVFAAKTDIELRASTGTDANGIAAGFDIVLVDN